MNRDDHWSVSLSVAETDGRTHAEARLNPADQDIWTIGAQIAAARALSDLAGQLLHAAATGIEAITHERAQLNL